MGTRGGREVQCYPREMTKRFSNVPEEVYGKFKNASLSSKYSHTSFYMTTELKDMLNTVKKT